MKNILTILTIILVVLFSACKKSVYLSEGDFFHLKNDGADMPVWVMGNPDSDVILITVHGGPGDSGLSFHVTPGFQLLENDYLMVYWDQRFSGMSQGHTDYSTMNPEQFIEDLDKLVQLIEHKYPNKKLFMLGFSWGGQLSSGYLGINDNASKFKGWISLDGAIFAEYEAQLMREWILERVPEKLNDPDADHEFWQFIVDWYETNPSPANYSDYEPYWYVSALSGDVYDYDAYLETQTIPYGELILRSMFSMSYYVYGFAKKEDILEWDRIDNTEALGNINIPSMMLWGANDGVVPVPVANYVYDHLATDSLYKEIVLIDKCGHGPQSERPEEFYDAMFNFIETYKNF